MPVDSHYVWQSDPLVGLCEINQNCTLLRVSQGKRVVSITKNRDSHCWSATRTAQRMQLRGK